MYVGTYLFLDPWDFLIRRDHNTFELHFIWEKKRQHKHNHQYRTFDPSHYSINSSNEKDSVFFDRAAVVPPCWPGLRQLVPLAATVDFTTVEEAGDELTGDKVCSRAGHLPWIVAELAAPLLGIGRRPKLNGSMCRWWEVASYDKDSWEKSWSTGNH